MAFNQEAWDSLISQGYSAQQTTESEKPSSGIFSRIWDSTKERAKNAKKMFDTYNQSRSSGLRNLGEAAATGIGIAGQVAGGIGDVIGEGIISAGKAVIDDESEKEIADFVASIGQSKPVQRVVGAWEDFEQERPFASAAISGAANIVGLTGTGAVGKAATTPLKGAMRAGVRAAKEGLETALPGTVQLAKRAGAGISDVAESAGSQLLAMSPQTVRNIVEGRVSREAMNSLERTAVGNRVKEGLDKALDDLSGLGSEYDIIRKSGQKVVIPVGGRVNIGDNTLREFSKPLTDTLTEYGLSIDEAGRITRSIDSKPFDPQTINAIQDFVDTYGKTGELDANQFLNVRQAADRIASWDAKDKDLADSFVQYLRRKYDDLGKAQIDGLAKLDAKFAPMRQEFGMLRRDFLTPSGELKDTAYTSIANLTNKGREQILERLEKYVPGITQEIHLLRAVEDIANARNLKVGAYTKGIIAGGLTAAGNWQAGVAFFLLTHPTVAVPLLRKYGEFNRMLKGSIDNLLNKLDDGKPLATADKKVIAQMMSDDDFFKQSMKSTGEGRVINSRYGGMQDEGRKNARLTGTFDDRMDVPRVSSADDALLAEARKYKSADEFVKAQGIPVYHGTSANFDTKDFRGGYVTGDKQYADIYRKPSASSITSQGKNGTGRTIEFILSNDAKLFDYTNPKHKTLIKKYWEEASMSGEPTIGKTGQIDWTEGENLVQWMEDNDIKFDGIKIDEAGGVDPVSGVEIKRSPSIRIIDTSKIKTKDQLKEIWNKAHNK